MPPALSQGSSSWLIIENSQGRHQATRVLLTFPYFVFTIHFSCQTFFCIKQIVVQVFVPRPAQRRARSLS